MALIIIGITILATSMVTGGAAVAVSASAAPASSLPKIQTGTGLPASWHHTWKVRPGYVYFGEGAGYSAPRMKSIRWSYYGQGGARAAGRWWVDNCRPTCVQAGYWVTARAHFYHVFNHAGPGRNFGEVRVTWPGWHWHAYIDSRGQWNWTTGFQRNAVPATAASLVPHLRGGSESSSVRPTYFNPIVNDGGNTVTRLRWSRWSGSAAGSGKFFTHNCKPSCGTGKTWLTPVRVTAWRVRHGDYTRFRYHFTRQPPRGFPWSWVMSYYAGRWHGKPWPDI